MCCRFFCLNALILCLLVHHGLSYAACDNFNPMTGQTTTCNSAAPNPTTTNIQAVTNSTNVIVNILTGSALAITRTTNPVESACIVVAKLVIVVLFL